jgi:hypothetical protein
MRPMDFAVLMLQRAGSGPGGVCICELLQVVAVMGVAWLSSCEEADSQV